jgi:hypothetical protein
MTAVRLEVPDQGPINAPPPRRRARLIWTFIKKRKTILFEMRFESLARLQRLLFEGFIFVYLPILCDDHILKLQTVS